MRLRIWSRRIGLAGALAIVIALCAVVAWTFALSWRPSDIYHFQGVDVSEAQGPIEWWTVKAGGADFAYLRATRGADERDTRFAGNWAEVYETGMRRGAASITRPPSCSRKGWRARSRSISTLPAGFSH